MTFELLRYAPNRVSGEFYNLAVMLYGDDGRLLDARFTPDFDRLRCHPLADRELLQALKAEFDQRRAPGEDFAAYLEELKRNLSQALEVSDSGFCLAAPGEEATEATMARLVATYLTTPPRSEPRALGPEVESPRAQMSKAFARFHLLGRLDADREVGAYVSPGFSFRVDYATRPNGVARYFHALSARRHLRDATRLCLVFDRIRVRIDAHMAAIVADGLPDDTRALLASSQIEPCPVSALDDLALRLRDQLGM